MNIIRKWLIKLLAGKSGVVVNVKFNSIKRLYPGQDLLIWSAIPLDSSIVKRKELDSIMEEVCRSHEVSVHDIKFGARYEKNMLAKKDFIKMASRICRDDDIANYLGITRATVIHHKKQL